MSALLCKILAMLIMLVDHSGVALYRAGLIARPLYRAMRIIGRGAFPIFCFQIAIGAKYTKKKWFYFLRIVLLAVISELVFDLALFATWRDPTHQNVFFTLALGLVCIYTLQWAYSLKNKLKIAGFAAFLCVTAAACFLAERVLYTDYGWAGVIQIAVMGVIALPVEKAPYFRERGFSERFLRIVICAAAIAVCAAICTGSEWAALYALVPIGLYNGKKGYSSRILQYSLYFFYPLHLLILGLLFVLPRMNGM